MESALGDQEWWEQFGFKGAVSEEKKRDYGNGVPGWSPYSRVRSGGPLVRTGLPADAYWFSQFGFKMGQDRVKMAPSLPIRHQVSLRYRQDAQC